MITVETAGAADYFVHPQAHVSRDASIGPGTKVWQFASVIRGARTGADCNVASCAMVDCSRLGDRVIVSHGASIHPGMDIGDDVFIAPNVTFCNDFWPRVSKKGYDFDAILEGMAAVTWVQDGASIGTNAIVLPGLVIGEGAMVAAGAVVTDNVPAGYLWRRNGKCVRIKKEKNIVRARFAYRGVLPVAAE